MGIMPSNFGLSPPFEGEAYEGFPVVVFLSGVLLVASFLWVAICGMVAVACLRKQLPHSLKDFLLFFSFCLFSPFTHIARDSVSQKAISLLRNSRIHSIQSEGPCHVS